MRVVPNLFPAFERQEVVIHSPRHVRSFADLTGEEIAAVADAWSERAEAARGEGYEYVHAFINEGREAGASRPHSHSQLIWLREAPADVAAEQQEVVAELLARGDLAVTQRHDVVAVVHPAGRVPYETLIAPRERRPDGFGGGDFLVAALELLADIVGRLRSLEGALAWNAWLHDGVHWHLELVPRLSVLAGIELGAGIYVNTVPPERAAAALREVAG